VNDNNPKTILLVEDEALIALAGKTTLEKFGYKVLIVSSGEKAVETVDANPAIDLILMDINLGDGIDGTEAAVKILEHHDLPLIFHSSHTERDVVEKTEGITSYGYIVKNSGETILIASIKMAFRLFEAKVKEQEIKKSLVHSKDLMSYIIEYSRSAIADHDRDLNYIYVSKRYLQDYNVKEKDIIGKHHYAVFPDLPQKWRDVHRRALAGETLSAEDDPYERTDGTVDWTRWECRPWYAEDCSIGGIIIYTEVITQQKLTEIALRRSEEKLSSILANISTGVWSVSWPRLDLLFYNKFAEKLFGIKAEEYNLQRLLEITHPDDRHLMNETVARLEKYGFAEKEYRILWPDGEIRWISEKTRLITGHDGVMRVDGIGTDITDYKRATESLQESEARFRVLNNASFSGIVIHDRGIILECNQGLAEMFGYTVTELAGMDGLLLIAEQTRDLVRNKISSGYEKPYEAIGLRKNGNEFALRLEARIIPYNGKMVRSVEFRDITDMKNAEDKLRDNLKYLQKILDTTPDGFWVVDTNGKFKDVNTAYCRMSGYNHDEFLRLRIPDIDADENASETADRILRIKTQGNETFQARHRRKDGSVFDVEVSASYFDHHEGEFVCFCRDISERIKVEESLRSWESEYKKAQSVANLGNWIWHIPTNRLEWSDQMFKIFGIERDKFSGDLSQVVANSIHPEDRAEVDRSNRSVVTAKVPIPLEYRIIRPDGSVRRVWAEAGDLVVDDLGNPKLLRGIVQDITERKQAEDKVKELLKERELLLKETHHRIKNNMSTISGLLTIQLESLDSPEVQGILRETTGRVRSMMVLYDKLYRSENFNELNIKEFIAPLVNEVLGLFPTIPPVTTEVRVEDFIVSSSILSPLGIIINEMITNSMKYAFPGIDNPKISVSASKTDMGITIVYQDNGVGLPETVGLDKEGSFGLQLIGLLVRQIGGTVRIERQRGTGYVMEVPHS
jgi:PAS domain S-box-containing protein